jgi:hypothetical protein
MLTWDPTDFMSCLGVLPVEGEHGVSHGYTVARDGVRLELTVFQYDGDVHVTLYRDGVEAPIVDFSITDCDAARWVHDSRGSFLELAAGRLFGGRYDGDAPIPYGVRVRVEPTIGVEFFRVNA